MVSAQTGPSRPNGSGGSFPQFRSIGSDIFGDNMTRSRVKKFAIIALFAALIGGCTAPQLQQAQTTLSQLQATATATQVQLDATKAQLAAASTQPSTPETQKTISALTTEVARLQSALPQVLAGVQQAQNLVTAMQTNTAPNLSPLSAFGPYGTLAGLIISIGWGVYQAVKNGPALAAIKHLQTLTATSTPTAAVSSASQSVAVTGIIPPNTTVVPAPAPIPVPLVVSPKPA
jgi:hypothetical protein